MRNARAPQEQSDIRRAAGRGLRGPDEGGNWFVCCPFCPAKVGKVDEDYKLTIRISGEIPPRLPDRPEPLELSPDRGVWNCYRCQSRGIADFRWLVDGSEVMQAQAAPPVEKIDLGPPEGFVPVKECGRSITMRWVPEYFERRGVIDAARACGAGGVHRGKYGGRVVVPFLETVGGPWLGFSARLVEAREGAPKYLYPRGMDRRRALWGVAWLPQDTEPLWIVEGVFDALPLYPRAVATLGKAVTSEQMERLVSLGRPLLPCLDGDAWEDCRALALQLRMAGARVPAWAHLPPMTDPGTLGPRVAEHLVSDA